MLHDEDFMNTARFFLCTGLSIGFFSLNVFAAKAPVRPPRNSKVATQKKPEVKKAASSLAPGRVLINKIVARVNGDNIYFSDLKKLRLGGGPYASVEEAINDQLYLQEAARRKMMPSALDIEKHIASIKGQSTDSAGKQLDDAGFERLVIEQGFASLKQFRAELVRSYAISNVKQVAYREKVFVTAQEEESYYAAHPEWQEERYLLKTCIVPLEQASSEQEAMQVAECDWIDTGWVGKDDIGEHMLFVTDLKAGQEGKALKTPHGYQRVKMEERQERRLKTIDERRDAIRKAIKDEKLKAYEHEFTAELRKRALIEYL